METKDTTTGNGNVCEKHHILKGIYCWDCIYRAGIKEVVEWIKSHKVGVREEDGSYSELPYSFWGRELQAKLKSWGIE